MISPSVSETDLLERLRAGDEVAFRSLVAQHHTAMTRIARSFVPTEAVADDVVQETWVAVIRGIDRFEGRSSLKTWIFQILINRARSSGVREHRSAPFSSFGTPEDGERTVDADRFLDGDSPFAGYWSIPPSRFSDLPEERVLAAETTALVGRAINALPERQQQVIALRDVEGWDADEVCDTLGITAANQRVLLHRARAAVRAVLEVHLTELTAA